MKITIYNILMVVFLASMLLFNMIGGRDVLDFLMSLPVIGITAQTYDGLFGNSGGSSILNFMNASIAAQITTLWFSLIYYIMKIIHYIYITKVSDENLGGHHVQS